MYIGSPNQTLKFVAARAWAIFDDVSYLRQRMIKVRKLHFYYPRNDDIKKIMLLNHLLLDGFLIECLFNIFVPSNNLMINEIHLLFHFITRS